MDNWNALFDPSPRFALEITGSPLRPDVLNIKGREALSEPFCWTIEFTALPGDIAPEQVLMKYASLRMRAGRAVHGVLTGLEWLSTTADQSHWRVTLESGLALLSRTRRCAVFQNQSVPEVVEQVLRSHGFTGPDFEFRLARSYPPRGLITQWRETDLEFIQRLLSEVGIWFRSEMEAATETETLIFADGQAGYRFGVSLPYREPSGLYDGAAESVWDVRTRHEVVTGSVATRDYNYRTAATPQDSTVRVRSDAVTTGEHYRYAAPFREAGDDGDPEPATESGAFYARLHHERELNKSARVLLFSNAAGLAPGQVLEPQGEVINALKEGVIITRVSLSAARDTRLHVLVSGMPYDERYCFRPVETTRPEIRGTLTARIESREKGDIYAHLDGHGRYRVRLDFDRADSEQGYAYLWLRLVKPYGGRDHGWHTPLTDGTEVAIAYGNGDIDLPYIAHALHDSAHPDHVARDNRTRNVLRTPANNKLRMEDRRGLEHIRLATEYGKTQLNAGHIVDAREAPRGTGSELRTGEYGALRAAKGLFISADARPAGDGPVLDMDAALREIERLERRLAQLQSAAEAAGALKADTDAQIAMFSERLKPLNEALHFSAPAGMAFTSGAEMQLAAAKNLSINAGGDISAGVMGNLTALAGEKAGLFTRTGQLSLKSGEGPVEVQAQNARLGLFAQKALTLTSTEDVLFAGKKRITLSGGGSYLKIDANGVEYGTTGIYMRRMKLTLKRVKDTAEMDFPSVSVELTEDGAEGAVPLTIPLFPEQYPVFKEKICIECLLNAIKANDAVVQGA
jgi:type VI secretion system secreted protein VgrG